ncbi:MAG: HEPN domain-containing protein [Ignavibacteriae bacterium]|nr:HEPN domain-containing protein [Ignavibacteriota bacterium]NOG99079.1 HEPN domain-containing protein [Ignavibacteriota bacterium]
MKEETKLWLKYAEENLEAARVLLTSQLYNPSLHNVQQSVEKSLKALFIEYGIKLKKSHSISELKNILENEGHRIELEDDESELLDSIYLPSKYPVGSALPDYYPDHETTKKCIDIARRLYDDITNKLK